MFRNGVPPYALLCVCLMGFAGACERSSQAQVTPSTPTQITPQTIAPPAAPLVPAATAVDLLRAVATDIAASSVYRNDSAQLPHIADGNLKTAWNARTGELTGAWIDVRIPHDATMTSIEMTAGFTDRTEQRDLFTSNQRISKVRVTRDGAEMGTFPLNIELRTLQSIPVQGAGGTYRLEFVELVAGSRTDWREVCVSELRVLGRAPIIHDGQRFPHFFVAALPTQSAASATTATPEHFIAAQEAFADAWARFDIETQRDANDMSEPGIPEGARKDYQRTRAQILNRLAAAIENQAPIQGDALRALAVRTLAASDLGTVAQALDAASATLTDGAQCAWSLNYIGLLLSRVSEGIAVQREINDMDDAMGLGSSGPSLDVLEGRLADLNDRFERNPNAVLAALKRVRMPNVLRTRSDWAELNARIARYEARCSW